VRFQNKEKGKNEKNIDLSMFFCFRSNAQNAVWKIYSLSIENILTTKGTKLSSKFVLKVQISCTLYLKFIIDNNTLLSESPLRTIRNLFVKNLCDPGVKILTTKAQKIFRQISKVQISCSLNLRSII